MRRLFLALTTIGGLAATLPATAAIIVPVGATAAPAEPPAEASPLVQKIWWDRYHRWHRPYRRWHHWHRWHRYPY